MKSLRVHAKAFFHSPSVHLQLPVASGAALPWATSVPSAIKAWTELLSAEVPVTAGGRVVGHAPDLKIRMEALKYLTDRRDGKAKQALEHTGEDRGVQPGGISVESPK